MGSGRGPTDNRSGYATFLAAEMQFIVTAREVAVAHPLCAEPIYALFDHRTRQNPGSDPKNPQSEAEQRPRPAAVGFAV